MKPEILTIDGQKITVHDCVVSSDRVTFSIEGSQYSFELSESLGGNFDIHKTNNENIAHKIHNQVYISSNNMYALNDHLYEVADFNTNPIKTLFTKKSEPNLIATVPGIIRDIFIVENQRVESNQDLMVLESMKVEHILCATITGTIDCIQVKKGDDVAVGDTLVKITTNIEKDNT